MNTRRILLAIVFLLCVSCTAFANRALERDEILQIFQQLTNQPQKSWIPAGTIEATHQEYRAPKITDLNEINNQINQRIQEYISSTDKPELTRNLQKMKLDAIPFNIRYELSNEYTMTSAVTVRFDGDRFYWEINVDSRTDSVKPGKELAGNFMTDEFNLDWNSRRIFAWDGENYTMYFLSGNNATVDSTGNTPHAVNGPLTAGFIPWGYGYYSYESLAAADSAAVEKIVDGQIQVHLTLNNSDGLEMLFVMDPEKDYAVISCSMNGLDNVVFSRQYFNYQSIAGKWVPDTIVLEQYEAGSNRLLARDLWDITSINTDVPESCDFDVSYEPDALIQHASFVSSKPQMYRYSEWADTEQLLAERLAFADSEGSQPQNCATVALKYAASQLGMEVADQQLAQLVNETSGDTSLNEMKQFVQELGLYCRAVTTDIQTLRDLVGCQVILHIPGKQHFVVLESIDTDYVWTIDLANSKFYYRTDINFFAMDWTEGTALVISDEPIDLQGGFTEIDDVQLDNIIGGSGYSCTNLLQNYYITYCIKLGGGLCIGTYRVFFERWGCEEAASGSCSSSQMIRYQSSPCINNPYNPEQCAVTGDWTVGYMRACA